ncbi:MAG: hypothetical protein A3D99_01875 [Candidatus Andersenbacteria bacterium RIFCSPHIGHO2_12_FULL_45_11]|uniref:Uncharacterized protein n=1 Tax=Candidatus Andersenbacteria bacterium RIFCSPHIGHO2_12_FULL_45_11 TaxID=1797281 RepID=A0A1G1X3S1_9BACT|nr:MAG: hypothetical protein A3D99_01875 [Candidatus Andersenbacteria bacterium RIFCSPHIGHO2_12_FULL_45_11]
MSVAAQTANVESTSILERSRQLKSCILQLENRRCAKGSLNPDDAQLLEQCIRDYAALRRQLG